MRAAAVTLLVLAAACGDNQHAPPDAGSDGGCFIGDPSKPAEVEIIYQTTTGMAALETDGGPVAIIEAPQGGKYVIAGVRAKNVTCQLQITGSLTDLCTGHPTADGRPIHLALGADGWGMPRNVASVTDYANINACPATWASRDVRGTPYTIKMQVTDLRGRTAEASGTVVPFCGDADLTQRAVCDCRCRPDYVLGEVCGVIPDAGPPAMCP